MFSVVFFNVGEEPCWTAVSFSVEVVLVFGIGSRRIISNSRSKKKVEVVVVVVLVEKIKVV